MPSSKKPRKAYRPRVRGVDALTRTVLFDTAHSQTLSYCIRCYLAEDGERVDDLLSYAAWMLSMALQWCQDHEPGSARMRLIHSCLRSVLQLSAAGAAWDRTYAAFYDGMLTVADRVLLENYSEAVCPAYQAGAAWLRARVVAGTARVDDVMGAELYQTKEIA